MFLSLECYRRGMGEGRRETSRGSPARPPMSQCLMSHPVSMSRCLNVSPGLGSQVSCLPFTPCHAARSARHRRSGNWRADMRPETRDPAGGHETLRHLEIAAMPMARPQGRQSLNVSCLTRSQCLAVSMSHQVSGLRSQVSPSPLATPRAGPAAGEAGTGALT